MKVAMRRWDTSGHVKSRKGNRREIDVDDLVLVDANPRIGAFNIDLTAFPHLRKCFKRNDVRNQKHPYWKCLLDGRAIKPGALVDGETQYRAFIREHTHGFGRSATIPGYFAIDEDFSAIGDQKAALLEKELRAIGAWNLSASFAVSSHFMDLLVAVGDFARKNPKESIRDVFPQSRGSLQRKMRHSTGRSD